MSARLEGFFSTVLVCPFTLLATQAVAGRPFLMFGLLSTFLNSGTFLLASSVPSVLPSLDLDPFLCVGGFSFSNVGADRAYTVATAVSIRDLTSLMVSCLVSEGTGLESGPKFVMSLFMASGRLASFFDINLFKI